MKRYVESNIPSHLYAQVRYVRGDTKKNKWTSLCWLKDKSTNAVVAQGEARCSRNDNPSRKVGRAICIGRALKSYMED